MLVVNWGCSPHFKQRGEVGFWRSCFSMPHRMPRRLRWQVKRRLALSGRLCGAISPLWSGRSRSPAGRAGRRVPLPGLI